MKVILLLALLSLSLCDDCTGVTRDVKECLAKNAGEGKTCCLWNSGSTFTCAGYTEEQMKDLEATAAEEGAGITITCTAPDDDKKSSSGKSTDTKTTPEDDSSSSNYLSKSLIILLSLLF